MNAIIAAKARINERKRAAGMDMYGIDEPRQDYKPVVGDQVNYTGPDGYKRSGVVVDIERATVVRMVRIEDATLGRAVWVGLATVRASRI